MSVQFKFKESVREDRRREIVDTLERAGFAARCLFPGQKRPRLAAIFTVPQAGAKDLEAVSSALSKYDRDIEYIEAAPTRSLKG
ncbi:MAG: hypothetical protein ACJ8FU_07680 [Xanthobacteraceae bacterium]|jgi:hypothetical protein